MTRILVSACLLGERVRYDGLPVPLESAILDGWKAAGWVVPFCPEVAAGLPVPRPPAEIAGSRVVDREGRDLTGPFLAGAQAALALAREHGIRIAVLKDRSPSCGSSIIYDGTFSGMRIPGEGITAALLRRNGIAVFSELQLERAEAVRAALCE